MIRVHDIQRATAAHFGLPTEAMTEPDGKGARLRERARPRQLAMYLSASLTAQSYKGIGRTFHRDHSTVIHAVRATRKRLKEDSEEQQHAREIVREVV